MKKGLVWVFCMFLMFSFTAQAEPSALTIDDIRQIQNTGYSTVGEYIDAFKPQWINWDYVGEATGETYFTLELEGGSIQLSVLDAEAYQDSEAGWDGAETLAGDVLGKEALLIEACWYNEAMTLQMPRGIQLGMDKQTVLDKIELQFEEPNEFNHGDSGFAQVVFPEDSQQWHEYYNLYFEFLEGKLDSVLMWYEADPE